MAELWRCYAAELLRLALGKNFNHTRSSFDPARYHLAVAGLMLATDLGNKDQGTANLNRYTLANNVPARSLAYTAWSEVFTAYRLFLDFIELNPEAKASSSETLETLYAQLLTEPSATTTARQGMPAPPVELIPARPEGQSPNGRPWDDSSAACTRSGRASPDLRRLRARLHAMKLAGYGRGYVPILEAINKCSDIDGAADITAQNQYNMLITTDPSNGYHSYVPSFTVVGFDEKYLEWLADSAAGRIGPVITLDINCRQAPNSLAEGHADALFGNADFFLHPRTTNCYLQQSGYNFELRFTGLGTFQLVPGPWFDLNLIAAYKACLPASAPRFFGPGGSLGLLPSLAILCLEPELRMRWADRQSYETVKAVCQTAPGPPQEAQGGAGAAVRFADDTSSIIFGPDKTSVPNLLGVISLKL